jgi:hypothetical protein
MKIKLDDAILEELERGGGTIESIGLRLSRRVSEALERMAAAGLVSREGEGNRKTYRVPNPTRGQI